MLEQLLSETDADWACHACANGLSANGALQKARWRTAKLDTPNEEGTATAKQIPTPWALPSSSNDVSKSASLQNKRVADNNVLLPASRSKVVKGMSEERYFAQFVLHTDRIYDDAHAKGLHKYDDLFLTDDACFLCKDGGDLIECDWKRSFGAKRGTCKCRKVYHEYCLAYDVPEGKTWICPRHYCDGCATQKLAHMCKYCQLVPVNHVCL